VATPARATDLRAVVLVEGISDRVAVEALAARHGRDLDAEHVAVVAIGGAQAIGRVLARYGPQGLDVQLAGLCDAGEERDFRRALEHAGLGRDLTRAGMEALGFFVCDADLEDELIRALGAARVEQLIETQGELRSYRTLQKQPAQRERTREQQLARFMGSRSGRKAHYAQVMVDALDLRRVPRPLEGVLARV
jgi:hypothetical protein